jgi:DNA-binding IscR family transcriptional regulator
MHLINTNAFRALIFLSCLQREEKATFVQITETYETSKSHLSK